MPTADSLSLSPYYVTEVLACWLPGSAYASPFGQLTDSFRVSSSGPRSSNRLLRPRTREKISNLSRLCTQYDSTVCSESQVLLSLNFQI